MRMSNLKKIKHMVVKHGLHRATFPQVGVVKHQLTNIREEVGIAAETFFDQMRE
jgi:hypothetical protein